MTEPVVARPGRNEPCHCGSGRKYKHCCLPKDEELAAKARAEAAKAEANARAASKTEAGEAGDETAGSPASEPARAPKHQTQQPWKVATSRGFVPRTRAPRKVGGS